MIGLIISVFRDNCIYHIKKRAHTLLDPIYLYVQLLFKQKSFFIVKDISINSLAYAKCNNNSRYVNSTNLFS